MICRELYLVTGNDPWLRYLWTLLVTQRLLCVDCDLVRLVLNSGWSLRRVWWGMVCWWGDWYFCLWNQKYPSLHHHVESSFKSELLLVGMMTCSLCCRRMISGSLIERAFCSWQWRLRVEKGASRFNSRRGGVLLLIKSGLPRRMERRRWWNFGGIFTSKWASFNGCFSHAFSYCSIINRFLSDLFSELGWVVEVEKAAKTKVKFGEIAYKFWKEFHEGWFVGEVTDIFVSGGMKKIRRCTYSDGDAEDLTLSDLKQLAKLSKRFKPSW